jgi:hypothetical protein
MRHKMDEKRKKRNQRMKTAIGMLLLIAVAYFILTNFDLPGWPRLGIILEGPKATCTEIRGPKTVTDTVVEKLKVRDAGFRVVSDERRAELTVENTDNTSGEVRVMLFCRDGEQQGEQKQPIAAGATGTFTFLDVDDCDLDYIIQPELLTRKVTRTAYATDTSCE